MGQEQSSHKKSSHEKSKVEINKLYIQYQAERVVLEKRIVSLLNDLHKETNDNWTPKSMNGQILFTRQSDGSTVRELLIPTWNVVFYNGDDGIAVRDTLVSDIASLPVTINMEDSILFHTMWIRSFHLRSISTLVQPVLTHYLTSGDSDKK